MNFPAELTFYSYPPIFVGCLIALLGFYALVREHASPVSLSFCWLTLCTAVWLVGYGIVYSLQDYSMALVWIRLTHLGVSFLPALVLLFVLQILGKTSAYRPCLAFCFILSSLFCFIGIYLNFLIEGARHFFWGYYAAYGPVRVPFLIYFLTTLLASFLLLWRGYREADSDLVRQRLKIFLLAFFVGYFGSVDFLAAFGVPVYPFGYVAVLGFIVLSAYAILKYRLIALTPAFAAEKILETMHGAIFVTDVEQRIRVLNSAAGSMLGYGEEELIGRPITQLMESPLEVDFNKNGSGKATLKTHTLCWLDEVRRHRMNWIRKDGSKIKVGVSASFLKDGAGQPVGVVYAAADITDQIKAEEALREKENIEMKAQFISVVSHELRTPLTAIKLSVDIVAQETAGPVNPDQKEYLQMAQTNLLRLNRLINDVLDFQKLDSGQMEFDRRPYNVNEIIKELGPTVSSLAADKGLEFKLDLALDLPRPVFDKDRIGEVVMNFISNAIKFTDQGGITVRTDLAGHEIRVSVYDTGEGIAREDLPKLFKNFSQLHNEKRKRRGGTGLGLAISKKIVEQHGGGIGVESKPGKGSEFFFTLPLRARGL